MEGARFPPRNLQPIAKTARGGGVHVSLWPKGAGISRRGGGSRLYARFTCSPSMTNQASGSGGRPWAPRFSQGHGLIQ